MTIRRSLKSVAVAALAIGALSACGSASQAELHAQCADAIRDGFVTGVADPDQLKVCARVDAVVDQIQADRQADARNAALVDAGYTVVR